MFERSLDFAHASTRQLERWRRSFPEGTQERRELEDELLYREYAWMYGEKSAMDMMDVFVIARTKYDQKMDQFDKRIIEQGELEWDSIPPIDDEC